MPGIIELLAILLSLGAFGAAPNPKAPAPAEVMKYAPADYDFMIYTDVEVVLPKNFKALTELKNHPEIKKSKQLLEMHRRLMREIETAVSGVQSMMNFDPINDIKSIAVWVKLKGAGSIPDVLAVVRGKLPVDGIKGLVSMTGASLSATEGSKGELIVGTPAWVDARAKDKKWKPKKANARVVRLLKRKPILAVASTISDDAARTVQKEFNDVDNVLTDLLSGHSFAGFYIKHNGIGWTWAAKSKDGYKRALMASEGGIELLRSGHMATRGLAKILLSGLDSYKGQHKELDLLIANKGKILKAIMDVTGDGRFKAKVSKQANKNTVAVQLSGRRLSEVFPLAGMFTLGGAAAWLTVMQGAEHAKHATAAAAEPAVAEAPRPVVEQSNKRLRVRETYRAARARHGL